MLKKSQNWRWCEFHPQEHTPCLACFREAEESGEEIADDFWDYPDHIFVFRKEPDAKS